jgi:hypothetical protein
VAHSRQHGHLQRILHGLALMLPRIHHLRDRPMAAAAAGREHQTVSPQSLPLQVQRNCTAMPHGIKKLLLISCHAPCSQRNAKQQAARTLIAARLPFQEPL